MNESRNRRVSEARRRRLAERWGEELRAAIERLGERVAPASAPDPAGGFPWEWVAGALGATALAGGGLVTWRRRREAAPTRPGPQAAG